MVSETVRTSPAGATAEPQAAEPFNAGRVLTVAGGHLLHDAYASFLPPLLPLFIANLGLSKTQAGLLNVFQQGPSLLQPVVGHLSDRVNLRPLVFICPAVTAVLMSLLGIAPNYAALALLLIGAGISSASFHGVGPATAGYLSGRRLGQGMSLWMAAAEVGRTLGPIAVAAAVTALTLRGLPWLMVFGLLGAFALHAQLRGVPDRPLTAGNGLPLLRALRGMGRLMLPVAAILLLRGLMISAVSVYLPTFLTEEGASLILAGSSLSVYQAAGTVGALLGGSLSDRLGRRQVLALSLLLTPLGMLVFLATGGAWRILSLLVVGAGSLACLPVLMAVVQEGFPENRALANGLYQALNFVGTAVLSLGVGFLGDLLGLRMAFTVSTFVALLAVPLVLLLPLGAKSRQPVRP